MLSLIEAGLNRPWYRLSLPEPLEARFAARGNAAGIRRMRSWLFVFIGFNLLSVKVDLDMFGAEAVAVPAALTLGVFVPVTFAAILALSGNPSRLQQTAAAFVTSVVDMAITLNSARIAPEHHADIYLILSAIIPLVVGMIAPMSFRHSLAYCATCFAVYVAVVVGFGLGRDGSGVPLLVASLILVPLKLSFSQEWEMKQSFLLGLRDRIQADALTEANARLTVLSETDPLTGVANRRLFGERLETGWTMAAGRFEWLGLALVDIDHFKTFNDAAGHAEGDACLRAVAKALEGAVAAQGGFVARYGGEEFVALLPGADRTAAAAGAARLHAAVAGLTLPHPGLAGGAGVSVSIGVAAAHGAMRALGVSASDILNAADQALYRAKRKGRDRVETGLVPLPGRARATVPATAFVQSASRAARP